MRVEPDTFFPRYERENEHIAASTAGATGAQEEVDAKNSSEHSGVTDAENGGRDSGEKRPKERAHHRARYARRTAAHLETWGPRSKDRNALPSARWTHIVEKPSEGETHLTHFFAKTQRN